MVKYLPYQGQTLQNVWSVAVFLCMSQRKDRSDYVHTSLIFVVVLYSHL